MVIVCGLEKFRTFRKIFTAAGQPVAISAEAIARSSGTPAIYCPRFGCLQTFPSLVTTFALLSGLNTIL
jgi:hypothetical protein